MWMDLEGIIPSEFSQRQILFDLTYIWNPKKKKTELLETENRLVVARDRVWGVRD